ncbi:MAG: metallophosphoesterase, partial [Gemmatimonadaceae bacterium]|nr:metallophosphoesterase [Gemmatimonadaceae bacterium]
MTVPALTEPAAPTVLIAGDTHMAFDHLVAADRTTPPGVPILHVGDLDYTPASSETWRRFARSLTRDVFFLRGNHDLVPMGWRDAAEPVRISPQLYFVPDGTVLTIGGLRIGCVGGASSIDRAVREPAGLWDPHEGLRPVEELRAMTMGPVDLLVTHIPEQATVQRVSDPRMLAFFNLPPTWRDPVADVITRVRTALGMPPIVSGHMHRA